MQSAVKCRSRKAEKINFWIHLINAIYKVLKIICNDRQTFLNQNCNQCWYCSLPMLIFAYFNYLGPIHGMPLVKYHIAIINLLTKGGGRSPPTSRPTGYPDITSQWSGQPEQKAQNRMRADDLTVGLHTELGRLTISMAFCCSHSGKYTKYHQIWSVP